MKIDLSDIRFLKILTAFKLTKYFEYLIIRNNANSAGYHNFNHTKTVVIYCYEIAKKDDKLSVDEIRTLLLAALFHDFNHSQGKFSDTENVKNAIAILRLFCIGIESANTINTASEIIKATEFPHVIPDEDLTPLQIIIQDADFLQMCTDDFIQTIMIGYFQSELNQLDFKKNLEGELKFLNTVKYQTDAAKEIAAIKLPEKIALVNRMLALIKN